MRDRALSYVVDILIPLVPYLMVMAFPSVASSWPLVLLPLIGGAFSQAVGRERLAALAGHTVIVALGWALYVSVRLSDNSDSLDPAGVMLIALISGVLFGLWNFAGRFAVHAYRMRKAGKSVVAL
jgi:hypothetical protein